MPLEFAQVQFDLVWMVLFAIKTVPLESMMEFLGSKISNREEQWKKFILDWRAWYWTRQLTCKEKALPPWFLQAKQLCAESEWFQRKDPLMKQNETWRYLELSICEPNISPIAIANVFSLYKKLKNEKQRFVNLKKALWQPFVAHYIPVNRFGLREWWQKLC